MNSLRVKVKLEEVEIRLIDSPQMHFDAGLPVPRKRLCAHYKGKALSRVTIPYNASPEEILEAMAKLLKQVERYP